MRAGECHWVSTTVIDYVFTAEQRNGARLAVGDLEVLC